MKRFDSKNNVNSSSPDIRDDNSLKILKLALEELKEKYNVSSDEILSLIEKKPVSKEILITVDKVWTKGLSALEVIWKYMKEEVEFNYAKIALLLNRNNRTIWTTYNNAVKKKKEKIPVKESRFFVPVSVFKDRKFSVLEVIVSYLKDNFNLRYSEIAVLLARDERNIWTVYNRSKKKK